MGQLPHPEVKLHTRFDPQILGVEEKSDEWLWHIKTSLRHEDGEARLQGEDPEEGGCGGGRW